MDLSPYFVTAARASIAGVLALLVLLILKKKTFRTANCSCYVGFPRRCSRIPIIIRNGFTVFYLCSFYCIYRFIAFSNCHIRDFSWWRKHQSLFWIFSILGSLLVVGYAVAQGISVAPVGDLLMILAIILCALSYAEGAKLSKDRVGGRLFRGH